LRAFETVGGVAELPELDFVGEFESFEGDGYLVWVGALWWLLVAWCGFVLVRCAYRAVGVQDERLDA